jgi:predicted adenine nucleotide alpha hydrolase (AANH) superfamily ATPase
MNKLQSPKHSLASFSSFINDETAARWMWTMWTVQKLFSQEFCGLSFACVNRVREPASAIRRKGKEKKEKRTFFIPFSLLLLHADERTV